MTKEVREQCQCREDQIICETCCMIEILTIVVFNVKFQNHSSIMKYDDDFQSISQFCTIHYQTYFIDHHLYFKMGHHQNLYHQIQKYLMNFIDHFESCLIYQNHEFFQNFVHCVIQCEELAMVFQDKKDLNDFNMCEMCFCLVSEVHTLLP